MNNIKITYVSKSKLYPSFGEANESPPRIRVRKDLPVAVKKFVLEHEKYHIRDWQRLAKENKKYYWIWGEIKASVYGSFKHPFGSLICGIMSLQPYRIKFYFKRLKRGDDGENNSRN